MTLKFKLAISVNGIFKTTNNIQKNTYVAYFSNKLLDIVIEELFTLTPLENFSFFTKFLEVLEITQTPLEVLEITAMRAPQKNSPNDSCPLRLDCIYFIESIHNGLPKLPP